MQSSQSLERRAQCAALFSPRTPIAHREFLAGRRDQIAKLTTAVLQPGAHAIIYGERGVGKTSLANCTPDFLAPLEQERQIVAPRVNCDGTDDFSSVWRKVLSALTIAHHRHTVGLRPEVEVEHVPLSWQAPEVLTPHAVREFLSQIGGQCQLIVTLDEFDRLTAGDTTRLIADTIKGLADHLVPATVIIVGVGDSISQLVEGHESVARHLLEVPMPRMSKAEMEEMVQQRLDALGLKVERNALELLCILARGLPYYIHLLGGTAANRAIDDGSNEIDSASIGAAVDEAITHSERAMKAVYYDATKSSQRNNILAQCLAAAALAACDEFGYFTPADMRTPMSRIMKRPYDIPLFNRKLVELCEERRGRVLQKSGRARNWRFRFRDPLMAPFVVLNSLAQGIVEISDLSLVENNR